MSYPTRLLAPLLVVLATSTAAVPLASADPDINANSAAAVIDDLKAQGYAVEVKGVTNGDTSLLAPCKVTSINKPVGPTSDPTTITTVYVEVACPVQHS